MDFVGQATAKEDQSRGGENIVLLVGLRKKPHNLLKSILSSLKKISTEMITYTIHSQDKSAYSI